MKGHALFQEIFFSRTTGPVSTNLITKVPWANDIQVSLDEGPHPFPRGNLNVIVKIHCRNVKILFSRTTGPISIKLTKKHPWVEGIQIRSNEGPYPFPRRDYPEMAKIHR